MKQEARTLPRDQLNLLSIEIISISAKAATLQKTVFEEDCSRLMILKGEGHEIIAKVQFYLPCVTSFPLMIHGNVSILPHFQDLHRDLPFKKTSVA